MKLQRHRPHKREEEIIKSQCCNHLTRKHEQVLRNGFINGNRREIFIGKAIHSFIVNLSVAYDMSSIDF